MGSSTKKHKKDKDSKKKKYRSRTRSRSPLSSNEREKERRHHKKHKDRKRDRSPDVQEVPVDSHLHRSRSTEIREKEYRHSTPPRVRGTPEPPAAASESLSIEETNRLRAKLGLKPLQLEEKTADDGKIKDDLGEFYHKPATNIADQKKAEKIKARLAERKEKRQLEERLLKGTLVDEGSDEDEDAVAWVKRNREITRQKEEAAKRAAMLDEMDKVFGVSALVNEEEQAERGERYTANNLRGLKVAHDTDTITEGRDVVLTLADKEVLAEDDEDVLVNVNIVDDERYKKNVEMKRKSKLGYQAYEDADDLEAAALGVGKTVLSKYDEEIEGEKNKFKSGFIIGDEDALEIKKFKQEMIREKLASKRLESLKMPDMQVASDYYSEQELQAKFKKPKRKGKMRKKAKTEPIDVDEYDPSSAPLETDDTDVKIEYKNELLEDDEEQDTELEIALARARRMRLAEEQQKIPKLEEILEKVKNEPSSSEDASGHMVLDSTAEFCRTLGDIPTYGQAGNRDEDVDVLMDFEVEEPHSEEPNRAGGAWNSVDVKADVAPQVFVGGTAILDVEPSLGAGVGGALRLALSKGYLECGSEGAQPARAPRHAHLLRAQHYSIDDKAHNEDDKFSRRGDHQRYAGPLTDFREKDNFRPDVKLEYIDDEGRPLCPKEAFRYLSHKFHGKGPGKNKQEKRIKKNVQEGLMKKMSSTDTPLGTLAMLQGKQKETQSPYILLSGPKRDPTRHN